MNYQDLLHSPIISTHVASLIQKAAQNNVPVLIQGEQGTKKDLIAKVIHDSGDWKFYRYYKIDCKLLTAGAFWEYLSRVLKEINYGTTPATLYFKEVGSLEHVIQSKLLELIEEGVFQNEGEKKVTKNLRFIFSSSEKLKEKVAQKKFSEDLYERINTLAIRILPLRDRLSEIPAMAQHFLAEHAKKMKIKKVGISHNVLILFQNYWWPGNLRELEHVILRSALFSEGDHLVEKDLFFVTENENNLFISFVKKFVTNSSGRALPKNSLDEPNKHFLPLLMIELVHRIKNPLVSIKTFTQLLKEKFNDVEFREYFYKIVTQDIEKIDTVLNGLLNYIKINTPIKKTNTIHAILEEVIKNHEIQFEDKKIKIFKKFEKDLPETIIHDEQLRYFFNSLLQYALPSIPLHGSIGFLTKFLEGQKEAVGSGMSIEVLMVFTGYKKAGEKFETVLGIPGVQQEESIELELRLIKEMVQKNQGRMRFEVNEKKPRTLISLRFPVERRKEFYYQFSKD